MKCLGKLRACAKDKKGFTLIEMVVVMVIIAILATLMMGALNGYIDKAKEKLALTYCRSVVVAAQAQLSEAYAAGRTPESLDGGDAAFNETKVRELAAIPDETFIEVCDAKDGKVDFVCVRLSQGSKFLYTYEDGEFFKGQTIYSDSSD